MNTVKRIGTGAAFGLALLGMGAGSALAAPGDSPTEPIVSSTPDPLNPLVPCETGQAWSVVTPAVPGVDAVTHKESKYLKEVPAQDEVSHLTFGIQERIRDFKPGHPAVDEVTKTTHGSETRSRTYTPAIPGQDAVTHLEHTYRRTVEKTKTQYQWEKHVSGNIETKNKKGKWEVTGTFTDLDYPGAGPVWQDGGSGGHNSYFNDNGMTRFHSTSFTYVKTGVTREVPDGTKTETSGWLVSPPAGSGWVKIDTKTVTDKAAVPAVPESYGPWIAWTVSADGLDTPPVLKTNTSTNEYRATTPQTVVVSEAQPAVPDAFGDWSGWTTKVDGLLQEPILKTDTNTHEFRQLEPVKVVDKEAREGYTVYYREGKAPTKNKAKASWVEESPGKKWTQFDERTITDAEAIPEIPSVTVYYSFTNDEPCAIVVPPVDTPVPPVVDKPVPPVVKPAAPVVKPMVEIVKVVAPAGEVKMIQPAATVTSVSQPRLAQTGAEIPAIALGGLALVGAGGVMAAAAGRRRKVTS